MGNCMNINRDKCRVIFYDGKEKEFKSSTPVKKVASGQYRGCKIVHTAFLLKPLPPDAKLEGGELYYVILPLESHSKGTCGKQKIKIVLTREQLLELLGNGIEFKPKGVALRMSESFRQKWLPSLSSIQEEHNFDVAPSFTK